MKRSILVASIVAVLALGISNAQIASTPSGDPVAQLAHWVTEMPSTINFNDLSSSQAMKLSDVLKGLVQGYAPSADQAQQALKDLAAALPSQQLNALQDKASHTYGNDTALIDFNDVWASYNTSLTEGIAALDNEIH